MVTAQQFWDDMPLVTKYFMVFSLSLALVASFGVVDPYYLVLDFDQIFSRNLQIWRLVTNVFFFGGLGINLIFNLLFFIQFSGRLEKDFFQGRTADFVFMLLVGLIPMTFCAWLLRLYLLSSSLLMFLVYVSCNKNPEGQLGLMFIPITIPARYFPWALMGLHVLMGGSPIADLVGIVCGHIYHYLDDYYPRFYGQRILKTPQFLYNIFPPTRMGVHGVGGAQAAPPQQQQQQANRWGAGRRLASMSRVFSRCYRTTPLLRNVITRNQVTKRLFSTVSTRKSNFIQYALGAVIVVGGVMYCKDKISAEQKEKDILEDYGQVQPNLPEYTLEEIAKNQKDRIWVTFRHGVYDVTDFVTKHPGGDKILLAAGKAVDPFWMLYAVHKTTHVLDILEEMRIGNIAKKDREALSLVKLDENDPYKNDPERFPALVVRNQKPFNAEAPVSLMVDNVITPNELFFVRNHLPVPTVDANVYRLTITGKGIPKQVELTLDELKQFKQKTIAVTLQCAGNRRGEMHAKKAVKGLEWGSGAISTAEWTGVLLSDVLKHVGFDPQGVNHVQFEGLDLDPQKAPYGGSIPVHRAIDPNRDVLLAFKMNGVDIPRDHGYPVRVIVPGVVGARNVKWLNKIVTSEKESPSFWQQYDYKGFSPSVEFGTNEVFATAPAIQELPVQSAICEPKSQTVTPGDLVLVKGYAWSGGGRDIVRVDVVVNDGQQKQWVIADLNKDLKQEPGKAWAWTPFEAEIEIPENQTQDMDVCSRAIDESYNAQVENVENIWNFRGVLSNAWSCIKLKV